MHASGGTAALITFEGADASGKTTQAERLVAGLRAAGRSVTHTREPGGTELGERIRELVLDPASHGTSARTDALLFNAARAELVAEVIRPALDRGDIVVCDRFSDSTLAYQGYGSGLDLEGLRALAAWATAGLEPDLTILLDVPSQIALARRTGEPAPRDRFEEPEYGLEFHRRVADGFRALAGRDPGRWRVIDARDSEERIADEIRGLVDTFLAESEPPTAALRMHR